MHYLSDDIIYIECKNQKKISRGMGAVNTLIVVGDKESIIIDPGVWTYQYTILKKLSKRNVIDSSRIKKVFISHQHWDHSTLASYFQRNFGAKVFSHLEAKNDLEDEDIMLRNFFTGYKFLQEELEKYPLWVMKKAIHFLWGKYRAVRINKTLKDGEKINQEVPIEVVELPGHTPGNIGFYFPNEKILLAGDLIDLETGIGYDLNSPLSSFEQAENSVKRLLDMRINRFISGHGKIVEGEENCNALFRQKINSSTELRNNIIHALTEEELSLRKLISQITQKRNIVEYVLNRHVFYCYLESINKEKNIQFNKRGKKTFMKIVE